MEKPLSLVIEETRQAIADAVNNSHLPPALLAYIVKDVYAELRQVEAEQYQRDKISYEISLKEAMENAEKGGDVNGDTSTKGA